MDEMIAIIRGLTTGGFFAFHGKHYDIPSIKICPAPTEPVPILIGGHAEPALRRAARLGDGWMHAGGQEPLESLLGEADGAAPRVRPEREPFEIHVISLDAYTSTASAVSRTSASPTSSWASGTSTRSAWTR
jgi:alkanesulfonate monooxygenase SsuD/methylene tetrahydromethanopterin reductase-like flavin-dependent oxidoreductase (luciferase family)